MFATRAHLYDLLCPILLLVLWTLSVLYSVLKVIFMKGMYFPEAILGNLAWVWVCFMRTCAFQYISIAPWQSFLGSHMSGIISSAASCTSKSLQHAFLCRFMSIHFNIFQNKCHQNPIITVYWVDRKQAVKSLLGFSASIYEVHCKTKIHLISISLAINVGIMILSTYFQINLT